MAIDFRDSASAERRRNAMAMDIKQVSRKILEDVFGKGDLDYLDEACDRSYKAHDPLIGDYDLAGLKGEVHMYRRAFPDMKPTILGICAEGDTACVLWRMSGTHQGELMGLAPTGTKVTVEGITFDRFRNGKLVESFVQWDTLRFLQALGVVPRLELEAPTGEAERRPHA
jgi:predicted ester cyclase